MDRPCLKCHQYFDIREHNGKCSNCLTDNFKTNKNKKMKNFKDQQKVNHPKYGEGVINIDRWENIYVVTFNEVLRSTSNIGDDFYNQLELVEDLPNVGEYAYFWNDGWDFANYAKFGAKSNEGYYISRNGIGYKNISKTPPFK